MSISYSITLALERPVIPDAAVLLLTPRTTTGPPHTSPDRRQLGQPMPEPDTSIDLRSVTIAMLRYLPGTVGESQRITHIAAFPGETVPPTITLLCGGTMPNDAHRVELIPMGQATGAPCVICEAYGVVLVRDQQRAFANAEKATAVEPSELPHQINGTVVSSRVDSVHPTSAASSVMRALRSGGTR
ncbi:hypothetical protein [Saccharopolyspora shandongensis]|uniref:hypothetical protein n=1 Tax=Saccharopolyspora shandongensis TaxID=418495 RepID=UPI0033CC39B3